jgi:Fur family ferric uptake transcriptional regulator
MPSPEPVLNRNTRQRRAIREAFLSADRPLNPNEVLELAAAGHEGIGIATVYRNIKSLVEEGWLTTVELPGESARYELAGKAHHHHFHCKQCGKVYELTGCLPGFKALAPPGFQVTGHEVLLYGVCKFCADGR